MGVIKGEKESAMGRTPLILECIMVRHDLPVKVKVISEAKCEKTSDQ